MKLPPSVADLQRNHIVLELECIDRMYLNAYVPQLTSEGGIASFFRGYLGHRFASTKQAGPMTEAFVSPGGSKPATAGHFKTSHPEAG